LRRFASLCVALGSALHRFARLSVALLSALYCSALCVTSGRVYQHYAWIASLFLCNFALLFFCIPCLLFTALFFPSSLSIIEIHPFLLFLLLVFPFHSIPTPDDSVDGRHVNPRRAQLLHLRYCKKVVV
jgi:hypothetical protein